MTRKSKYGLNSFALMFLLTISLLVLSGNDRHHPLSASEADNMQPALSSGSEELDLTLEECVSLALQNNLEIRAQKNTVDESFHKKAEQITQGKPRIGAQHIYSLQERVMGLGESSIGDKETRISQVTLTQPIYTFGRLEKGLKLVRETYQAEKATLAATRANVMHRVILNFLDVLRNRNNIHIASETVEVLQEHLKLVKNLFAAGIVLNTDLSMTKVKVLEARQGLIESNNSFEISRLGLLQLIGIERFTKRRFQDIPLMPATVSTTLDNPGSQPEMKNIEHLIEAGKQNCALARRNNLPIIGLQATWSSGNQFMEDFKSWNANVVLDFPFFDSGSTKAKQNQALANLAKLKNIQEDTRQKFDLAISQSARNVQELQEKFALAMQIKEAAEENYSNLRNQYREGSAINTDVLEAQLLWSNAKVGVNNAYYDYVAFLADHYYSLGNIDGFIKLVEIARLEDLKSERVNP